MALNAMLHSAPAGRHLCQFHKDPAGLAESVGEFVAAGLKRGERVVVIAVPDHVTLLIQQLSDADWNPEAFQASGQLTVLDAAATLDRFMRDGMPDWVLFRKTIGSVLGRRPAARTTGTRAYGEMVNLLWHEGNTKAAVRLEEFWNDIAREHSFALLCCYLMDGTRDEAYHGPLHEIGRTHSEILPTNLDLKFQAAVDAASREILGSSLSMTLSLSGREDQAGEHRLPVGQRSILWLKRNMPNIYSRVLDRARHLYEQGPPAHYA